MPIAIQLGDNYAVQLGAIREAPEYSINFLALLGLVYMNWGRLEQTLEFLLRFVDDPRLVTGAVPRFPDTSFRLKAKMFNQLFGLHPRFSQFHEAAKSIGKGLEKANKSRVKMVHSNYQGFKDGPPPTMEVIIVKFSGTDLKTFDGSWTQQAIVNFNELLCLLNDDLAKIANVSMTLDFLQSLERPLSRIEKATLAARRLLNRLPRLRIERPFSQA